MDTATATATVSSPDTPPVAPPSPDRSDPPSPDRSGPAFIGLGAILLMAIVVAACLPFVLGADEMALGIVIPLVSWAPATVAVSLALVLGMRRRGTRLRDLLALGARSRSHLAGTLGRTVLLFVAAPVLAATVGVALGFTEARSLGDWAPSLPAVPVLVLVMGLVTLGEELMWRGAATTVLAPLGRVRAAVAIAGFWSLWHVPLGIAYVASGAWQPADVVVVSINLVIVSLVLSALREMSGSVWPAVLGHAMLNTVVVYVTSSVTVLTHPGDAGFWGMALLTWATWLVVLALVVRTATRTRPAVAP